METKALKRDKINSGSTFECILPPIFKSFILQAHQHNMDTGV